MPKYRYRALDQNGAKVRGEIEAPSQSAAYDKISARAQDIYKITLIAETSVSLTRNRRVKRKDLARYIRQLATLLGAGVSLLEALKSLSKSNAHPALSKASNALRRDLRAGKRLSDAMQNHLPALPPYVARLAELGEATGQSAKALADAADRMEYEDGMRSEIRTALSYPVFLSVVGSMIIFLLFLFVVPRFGNLIGDKSDNLPAISRLVINAGIGLRENLMIVLGGGGALVVGTVLLVRSRIFREGVRTFFENTPIIGPVLVQSELGSWARTVGIALDNGADLLSALSLGQFGLRSPRLARGFDRARIDIRAGRNIDEVLNEMVPDFDPLAIDLIRTGRTSGGLADMLLFIGKTQEQEARELSKRMATLAEPIAILIIAGIVGTVVISIVLAMTSLYDFG